MVITFDVYDKHRRITTEEFDGNPTHCMQYLASYINNSQHSINNVRIYP
jgi:hypothetical protein